MAEHPLRLTDVAVLIVDDRPANLVALEAILESKWCERIPEKSPCDSSSTRTSPAFSWTFRCRVSDGYVRFPG